jgi:hypothetical protein
MTAYQSQTNDVLDMLSPDPGYFTTGMLEANEDASEITVHEKRELLRKIVIGGVGPIEKGTWTGPRADVWSASADGAQP